MNITWDEMSNKMKESKQDTCELKTEQNKITIN